MSFEREEERRVNFVNREGYTLENSLKAVGEGWAELVKQAFSALPAGYENCPGKGEVWKA